MRRTLLLCLLAALPGCPVEPEATRLYLLCRCRPGAADCTDSASFIAVTVTEKCPKGAAGEIVCTGANCPTVAPRAPAAAPDLSASEARP